MIIMTKELTLSERSSGFARRGTKSGREWPCLRELQVDQCDDDHCDHWGQCGDDHAEMDWPSDHGGDHDHDHAMVIRVADGQHDNDKMMVLLLVLMTVMMIG